MAESRFQINDRIDRLTREGENTQNEGRKSICGKHMQYIELSISGMSSAACAKSIEEALNAYHGVIASVSEAESLARIELWEPIEMRFIFKRIESLGFKAELHFE